MIQDKISLKVSPRTLKGKKVKRLHDQGLVAGNIMVSGKDSVMVQVDSLDLKRTYEAAGESALLYLQLEGEKKERPVMVDELEIHPVSNKYTHVVFREVSLKEKIEADIPVEIVGELGVSGAVLLTVKDSVTVEALPTDLPEKFEIDAEKFTEIGQSVSLADLEIDSSKVELVLGEEEDPKETPIVLIQEEKVQEEPEETEDESEGEEFAESGEEKPAEEAAESEQKESGEEKSE